jgi:hypothetical protein
MLPLPLLSVMELMVMKNETTEGSGASSPVMNTAEELEPPPVPVAAPPPQAIARTAKQKTVASPRIRLMYSLQIQRIFGGRQLLLTFG